MSGMSGCLRTFGRLAVSAQACHVALAAIEFGQSSAIATTHLDPVRFLEKNFLSRANLPRGRVNPTLLPWRLFSLP